MVTSRVLPRGDDPPEPPEVLPRGDDPPEPPEVLPRGDDAPELPGVPGCAFCAIIAGMVTAHLVMADQVTIAFLDTRPVFKGHVLVVPRAHYQTLADLPAELIGPFFTAVQRVSAALPSALGAQGSFVGLNNVVSQSVPHLHVHAVPRTKGDGLRGFFWPRTRYASEEEAADYASKIRAVLAPGGV